MVSVLASTGRYILQPSLVEMHTTTLEWLSALELWKKEVQFFQKLLDQHTAQISNADSDIKKQVDHFQHLITYYGGELIALLRKKLHKHESRLAHMLQTCDESDTAYFTEHKEIMEELDAFRKTFYQFKHDYIEFIERGFSPYSLK
jgi:hypothetical protein